MSYHKFSSNYLFTGKSFLEKKHVLIADEKGMIIDIVPDAAAPSDTIYLDGIVCPGFINAHCHVELSYLAGEIPENGGMSSFLMDVIWHRNAEDEVAGKAMVNAIDQMERNGIVGVGDICNTPVSIPYKVNSRLQWYNFIEVAGVSDTIAQSRLDAAIMLQKSFKITGCNSSIVPHAPYSVSDTLFMLINNLPSNEVVTIHNLESKDEQQFFQSGTGPLLALFDFLKVEIPPFANINNSGFERTFTHLCNARSRIFVHNVMASQADFMMTSNSANWWCICPNANQYISDELPPFPLFFLKPESVLIGTDSLASNHSLDILSEIKTVLRNSDIKLSDLLRAATSNGARALQFDTELGSFEKGKTPGILFLKNSQNGVIHDNTTVQRLV